MEKIRALYFPSSSDPDHISYVELFLAGNGVFKHLFERSYLPFLDRDALILPETIHGIRNEVLYLDEKYISAALLTSRALNSNVDVTAKCSYRNLKEVEKNCKKALALCLASDSPYRNFLPLDFQAVRIGQITLILPGTIHGIRNEVLYLDDKCISAALLTSRALNSNIDVTAKYLYRDLKEVEKNCKKALALCLASDSPYRNFSTTGLPSGTDWPDYIRWPKQKMKCPDGVVSASLYDVLSDGASVCHNEEENVTFASCTTRRESEYIVGEDTIVAPVPMVVAGDVS